MSYSTVSSTCHKCLCSIATDKVLVEKEKEIEMLHEKIMLLTLQLTEREEKISQLLENIKGNPLLDILLYQIICLALQSQVVQLHDQIKNDDPQLTQKSEEALAIQQELSSDDKVTQEEPDDKVDDTSKLTSSDHETENITSQSKIYKLIGNIRKQFDWLVVGFTVHEFKYRLLAKTRDLCNLLTQGSLLQILSVECNVSMCICRLINVIYPHMHASYWLRHLTVLDYSNRTTQTILKLF